MGTVEIPLNQTVSLHYVEVHVPNVMSTTMINGSIWWSETKISHNETHILTPLFEYLFTYKRICAILSARHHQWLMLQTIPSTFFKFIHSVVCLYDRSSHTCSTLKYMDPDSQQTGTAITAALPAITIICRTPHSLVPLLSSSSSIMWSIMT